MMLVESKHINMNIMFLSPAACRYVFIPYPFYVVAIVCQHGIGGIGLVVALFVVVAKRHCTLGQKGF